MVNKLLSEDNIYCAGVYCLRDVGTGDIMYIGSAIDVGDARSRHLYNLKRDLYHDTNKRLLQPIYDRGDLKFEVLARVCEADEVRKMNSVEKEQVQAELSALEKEYIKKHEKTILNNHKSVTKASSNKNVYSTFKRSFVNRGSKNPNYRQRDEKIIAEILWLKINTDMRNCDIARHYDLNQCYTFHIGYDRWLNLIPIRPDWLDIGKEKASAEDAKAN